MPLGNGTGPAGQGPGTGRGSRRGGGQGKMGGNRPGAGPTVDCVCPSCGEKVVHMRGTPCHLELCPKCGARMVRG